MKTLLTLLLISICSMAFGQKDSIRANAIQLQRLSKLDSTIRANQNKFSETLELIFGVRIEEVESWNYENGMFKWKLKPKKK